MTQLAKEYAVALFELACEKGNAEELLSALQAVQQALSSAPEYPALLASPSIPLSERFSLIEEAMKGKVPEEVLSFLLLLCEKGRLEKFEACVQEFEKMYRAMSLVQRVKVESAAPLTEEEKALLIEKLIKKLGCKIEAEFVQNPALIGGLIVHMDDRIIDASVRRKLKEIKEELVK